MKPRTSIFRRERPPRPAAGAPRRRPGRSIDVGLASLERRALLAAIGPVALPSIAPAVAEVGVVEPSDSPTTPATPTQTFDSPVLGGSPDGLGTASGAGPAPLTRYDRLVNHVALAMAETRVDGVPTPEFALADAGLSKVFVRLGTGSGPGGKFAVLDASQGVDKPQSVVLGDVNGDGIPDLVVANSGGDDILVFPGLPGGLFGPEVNGGRGFAVGRDPVGVEVGDVNGDGVADLIVANKGSDSVSILDGRGSGAAWTATMAGTIAEGAGLSPVKTALIDVNHDGHPELFVCNSGSDTVAMYQGGAGGAFDAASPTVFDVGMNPSDVFIGRFDKRPQLDLVTVNSGSDDLTFIGGVFSSHPTTLSYPSGGVMPDAAFAVDLNHDGVMGLVVANSGDGHLALLQGTNDGMQLAGVITRPDLPIPTGLAPSTSSGAGLDFFAASAGLDAAQLLHFDLATSSPFLDGSPIGSVLRGGVDEELVAGLMPFGGSALELIAVFWAGSPDSAAVSGEWGLREPSTITALYSPTEGQGSGDDRASLDVLSNPASPPAPLPDPSKVDPSAWSRFVLGIDRALAGPRVPIEVVAARDVRETVDERPAGDLARLASSPLGPLDDPDVDPASDAVDEALRLFRSGGRPDDEPRPDDLDRRPDPTQGIEGLDAPALEGPLETVPLISTALLLSGRLILGASPPRPPSIRRAKGFRGVRQPERPGGLRSPVGSAIADRPLRLRMPAPAEVRR